MEEALDDIIIESRKVVINIDCDGEVSWIRPLEEVWSNQSVDQWIDWLTNPLSGEEVTNID